MKQQPTLIWGEDGWRSHRLVSYRARDLRLRYILFFHAPIQARILSETFFGVGGVESSLRSCAKEVRHLGWAPLFYHNPVSQVVSYGRRAGQLQVFVQAYHTPSCVRQQRFNCYHTRFHHTPKHTLWVFGRAITPPFYHPPSFITPPNTPCGCSDVLSHPLVYHPPLEPPASCTSSPGVHKVSPPRQYTTPGDNIFISQNFITGVCYLVSDTGVRVNGRTTTTSFMRPHPVIGAIGVSYTAYKDEFRQNLRSHRRSVFYFHDTSQLTQFMPLPETCEK